MEMNYTIEFAYLEKRPMNRPKSSIEKQVLQEYPFNKNGGVINLFKDRMDVARDIVATIDRVNCRLESVN